jgi:hypothetical protein
MFSQLGYWPLGLVPLIFSTLAVLGLVYVLLHPKGWRGRKGMVMLTEYGLAGICSLLVLFVSSLMLKHSDVYDNMPVTYLIGVISFLIAIEAIDRLLKLRLGASPIQEITRKRFLINSPGQNFTAALVAWFFSGAFAVAFVFLKAKQMPIEEPPSRLDILLGNHRYLYGFGWVFAEFGALAHLAIWSSIRQIRGMVYGRQ